LNWAQTFGSSNWGVYTGEFGLGDPNRRFLPNFIAATTVAMAKIYKDTKDINDMKD